MRRAARPRKRLVVGLAAALLLGGLGCSDVQQAAGTTSITSRPKTVAETSGRRGRVDLAKPNFSHPTRITNPLFPISTVRQVIQLGTEGGDSLRHEITLLPQTKVITWDGRPVRTRVSQFVAYGNGRIVEAALDYYAQADDGSVWYFGEHVDNYEDGVIANHDGTWLAGKDGPPGMIMPARPKVGDVYRPENIPGVVFEEVTVQATNLTVPGPRGRVRGAVLVQEKLMDGTLEDKIFAPRYGEFLAQVSSEDELATVALAVPTDSLPGVRPSELEQLSTDAARMFDAARSKQWNELSAIVRRMDRVWDRYQRYEVPELLADQLDESLSALNVGVLTCQVAGVRQAAIDTAHAVLDLQLQYRSPSKVDRARLGVWQRQLTVDRTADDSGAVAGDRAVINLIRDRIAS